MSNKCPPLRTLVCAVSRKWSAFLTHARLSLRGAAMKTVEKIENMIQKANVWTRPPPPLFPFSCCGGGKEAASTDREHKGISHDTLFLSRLADRFPMREASHVSSPALPQNNFQAMLQFLDYPPADAKKKPSEEFFSELAKFMDQFLASMPKDKDIAAKKKSAKDNGLGVLTGQQCVCCVLQEDERYRQEDWWRLGYRRPDGLAHQRHQIGQSCWRVCRTAPDD